MIYPQRQTGAATLELIVGCLAAIPLFFGISLLGKYADMQHKTVEAARYVAWENVIWADGRQKNVAEIALETTDRFMGNRRSAVVDKQVLDAEGVTEEALWRDYRSRTLMVSDGSTIRVNVARFDAGGAKHNSAVRVGAESGIPLVKLVANKSLGLDASPITAFRVNMPITNRVRDPKDNKVSGLASFFSPQSYELPEQLNLTATSGLLTDPWTAYSESDFSGRVKGLGVESEISLIAKPGTELIGKFFPFQEGRYGSNSNFVADSSVVLDEYVP